MGKHEKAALALVGLLTVGVATVLFLSLLPDNEDTRLLAWNDPEIVAHGEAIYAQECKACHGALGGVPSSDAAAEEPSAPPHDFRGHTWQHPDYALVQLTKTGETTALCTTPGEDGMPIFDEALSDRDILDVLSYIKSTWPDDIRAEQDALNKIHSRQNEAVLDLLDL